MNKTYTPVQELLENLKSKYPNAWFKHGQDFSPDKPENCIWSGEGSFTNVDVDGINCELKLFDYYSDDHDRTVYVIGVYGELEEFLLKHGWFAEFYDPGTVFLYPI